MASKTVTRSINPAIVFFFGDVKRHKKRATSDDKIKQPSTIATFDYIINCNISPLLPSHLQNHQDIQLLLLHPLRCLSFLLPTPAFSANHRSSLRRIHPNTLRRPTHRSRPNTHQGHPQRLSDRHLKLEKWSLISVRSGLSAEREMMRVQDR